MLIRFDNQVALVTGAAQGIGRAIAQGLSDAGARVHIADIDEDGVRAAADVMDATPHVCDLSDRARARAMVEAIVAKEHRLDILALAAGGVRGQVGRPLEDVTPGDWHSIFKANVDGAFYLAQAAAPVMKKHKRGRIITVSSGAGLRPSLTGIQAYSAAKHALIGLTKQLAQELGPFGVTVNSVAPGFVLSNPNSKRQFESYGPEGQKKLVESFYLKRLGTAEDIAHAVIFFASEQANWISGQVLSVDGGRA